MWLAWNEPNSSVFLQPQFARVGGKWQMAAPAAYAHICNAVYSGVHAAGGPERVACGATAPRGYNDPTSSRPSIAPLSFLRAAKRSGPPQFRRLGAQSVLRQPVGDPGDAQRRLSARSGSATSTP